MICLVPYGNSAWYYNQIKVKAAYVGLGIAAGVWLQMGAVRVKATKQY